MADRHSHNSAQQSLFGPDESAPKARKASGYAMMNCDGASSGNPGRAGIGAVIRIPEGLAKQLGIEEDYRISRYIGETTNNVAEYTALIEGLKKARSLGIKKIKVFLDSELIVKQIKGIYRVKNANLIPLFEQVRSMLGQFESYKVSHVPREMNRDADALARKGVKGGSQESGVKS
jgi:ribonuclease HI